MYDEWQCVSLRMFLFSSPWRLGSAAYAFQILLWPISVRRRCLSMPKQPRREIVSETQTDFCRPECGLRVRVGNFWCQHSACIQRSFGGDSFKVVVAVLLSVFLAVI